MINYGIATAQNEIGILREFATLMQNEGGLLSCIGTALSRSAKAFEAQQDCIEQLSARISQLEQNSK